MAGLQRGGHRDQQVGQLILESLHPPLRLHPDDQVRDKASDQETREDRNRASADDRCEHGEDERAADQEPGELDRTQGQVGPLEQKLQVPPLAAVCEGALGYPEQAAEHRQALTAGSVLGGAAPRRLDVSCKAPFQPRAPEGRGGEDSGREHELGGEHREEQVAGLSVERVGEQR